MVCRVRPRRSRRARSQHPAGNGAEGAGGGCVDVRRVAARWGGCSPTWVEKLTILPEPEARLPKQSLWMPFTPAFTSNSPSFLLETEKRVPPVGDEI